MGRKQAANVPTLIKDPVSGEEITDPKKIKEASVQYCKRLLTNREPKDEYKVDLEAKDLIHNEIMRQKAVNKSEDELNLTKI